MVFSGLWLPRGKYAHAHGSRYGQGPSDKWHQETAGNPTRRASLVTSRATVVSREPYRPGLWRWGRAHLLKKELREAEHFLSLLPIVFQKCFSAYFNLSWVQSFPNKEHWPLCGSCVYCYLYLWGSFSHRTRYHKPNNVFLATQHTYLCVLLWCSFRDFQMFIPTKHLGPTSILTFCGLSSQEKFHKDKTRWPDLTNVRKAGKDLQRWVSLHLADPPAQGNQPECSSLGRMLLGFG